nr:MAG TPA: hypothetical protein [Caudoviricetes sp.]
MIPDISINTRGVFNENWVRLTYMGKADNF